MQLTAVPNVGMAAENDDRRGRVYLSHGIEHQGPFTNSVSIMRVNDWEY